MKRLLSIFNRSIVAEYYRQNMVFIFVLILFCFGFLRAMEHITIIKLILKLPALLLLTFIVWAAYALKVALFNLRLLESRQYEFLYQARLFPLHKRFGVFCLVMFNLLQLTILYSLAMIKIGMDEKRYGAVGLILLINLVLIVSGALVLEYRIRRPNPEKLLPRTFQGIFSRFNTPSYLFFVRYLSARQPVLLLITKLFSMAVLLGFCYLYPTDDYDERFLAIAGLLVGASHIVFNQKYFQFEHVHLGLLRNLPLGVMKRYSGYLITYVVLLVPELLVLIKNLPGGLSYVFMAELLIFIMSIILFMHHLHYINGVSGDAIMQRLFFGGVGVFLLIMFKVPLVILSGVLLMAGIVVFRKHFYLSEYHGE